MLLTERVSQRHHCSVFAAFGHSAAVSLYPLVAASEHSPSFAKAPCHDTILPFCPVGCLAFVKWWICSPYLLFLWKLLTDWWKVHWELRESDHMVVLPVCWASLQGTGGRSVTWPTGSWMGHATSPRTRCGWPCVPPSSCGATSQPWPSGRWPRGQLISAWPSSRASTMTAQGTHSMAQVGDRGWASPCCSAGTQTLYRCHMTQKTARVLVGKILLNRCFPI